MKRAIIVHCWEGYPEYCWYPQTKKELEAAGFQVEVPAMPDTNSPQLANWLPALIETIQSPDLDLYLIGHSAGSVTILRYLEQMAGDQTIGGAVLVAGFTNNLGFQELQNFFEQPLDYSQIKGKAKKVVLIHSDNDPFVPMEDGQILQQELAAELIMKHGMKHFSGAADGEESCLNLPDVSQAILKMSTN